MAMHYMLRQLHEGAPPAPGSAPGTASAAHSTSAAHPAPAAPPAPAASLSAASLWRELKARLPGGRDAQNRPASSVRCRAIAQISDRMHHHHEYQRVRDSSLFTSSRR